jgi:hypothetical protein
VVGLFHGMGFKGEVGKNSLCAGTRRSQPEVFPHTKPCIYLCKSIGQSDSIRFFLSGRQ